MKIKEIPREEFIEMWRNLKGNMMITPEQGPTYHMKGMTVQGHSGPGTPFKDEYDRLTDKLLNPPIPRFIEMVTTDGVILYKMKK
jgi:hypothetical protein